MDKVGSTCWIFVPNTESEQFLISSIELSVYECFTESPVGGMLS